MQYYVYLSKSSVYHNTNILSIKLLISRSCRSSCGEKKIAKQLERILLNTRVSPNIRLLISGVRPDIRSHLPDIYK